MFQRPLAGDAPVSIHDEKLDPPHDKIVFEVLGHFAVEAYLNGDTGVQTRYRVREMLTPAEKTHLQSLAVLAGWNVEIEDGKDSSGYFTLFVGKKIPTTLVV